MRANRRNPTEDEWADLQRAGWSGEREWITFPEATVVVDGAIKIPKGALRDGGVIIRNRAGGS